MLSPITGQATLDTAPDEWVAIIDDHESMRLCLSHVLRFEGIRTEVFASAEAYLDHDVPTPPCCLVLDMQLPGMKGHELKHYLERERLPQPPTIFMTANHNLLATLDDCCVAHGRLGKPFEIDALLALVKPLLRNGRPVPADVKRSTPLEAQTSTELERVCVK